MINVAFLVNGDERSAIAERAKAFASRLGSRYNINISYRSSRKIASAFRFFGLLVKRRPSLIYVFDMSYSGVLAGILYKSMFGARLIIDTGDAVYDLAKSMGRSRIGLAFTRLLETISFRAANRIVVRGTFHKRLLEPRGLQAEVIQDGVDTLQFRPMDASALRRESGLEGYVTVGVVGSVVWNEALGTCYGSEVVRLVHLLEREPVKGVIIGDGPGLTKLKALCSELGMEDRILFRDRVPYEDLPGYLNLIDVCISTQTNDVVGKVRTTGKLPLYMATGRYILATRVGEASLCLPDEMLVYYGGAADSTYPQRLADRVHGLLINRAALSRGFDNVAIARARFDYSLLAGRLAALIDQALAAADALECADKGGALDSSR